MCAELRDMRHKADADKRNEILAAKTMSSIEARAQKQYEQDLKAQTSGREELTGKWVYTYIFQSQKRSNLSFKIPWGSFSDLLSQIS